MDSVKSFFSRLYWGDSGSADSSTNYFSDTPVTSGTETTTAPLKVTVGKAAASAESFGAGLAVAAVVFIAVLVIFDD